MDALFAKAASHSRRKFALVNMIGKTVQVQTMNGVTYEGILHAAAVDKGQDVGVALKMAYKCTGRIGEPRLSALKIAVSFLLSNHIYRKAFPSHQYNLC